MINYNLVTPGYGLIHFHLKKIMSGKSPDDLHLSQKEIKIIKRKLDAYLMYIWTLMGDTRYNRSGYRNAFESLEQHINKNS